MGLPLGDDERVLASQIANGDQHAASVLDRRYRRVLEDLARLKGFPLEDCKDLAQEVLISAVFFLRRGGFRGDSSLRTLLISILRRKIVDGYRKQLPNQIVHPASPSEDETEALAYIETLGGPVPHPEIKLMTEQALQSMPDEHRMILLMNQMGGYTIEEIASTIKRTKGSVGRMLAEAKRFFRKQLRPDEEK